MPRSLARIVVSVLFAAFLSGPSPILADTLSGTVLDTQGLAVPHASIRLVDRTSGREHSTTSAADGSYRFADLPPGAYVIEGTAATSALVGSQQVSLSGDQRVDLRLRIAAARTEVLVTASGTPQTVTEVGKAVDVVDAAQMALRDVFQISEALRVVPGLLIQTQAGPGSFTTISTRGLRNHDTAILFDGLRFQDSGSPQSDATAFLGDLVATDADRVEVLRGSSSSLYGSSAMGGVINVVSRPGGGPLRGEVRGEGGGLGMFRGVASLGGGTGSDRVTYSGAVSHVNIADGVRGRSPSENTSAQGTVRVSARPGLSIAGRFWGTAADVTTTESPAFTPAILANSRPGRVKAIPLPDDQLERFEQRLPFAAGSSTYVPSQIDPDGSRRASFFSGTGTLQHVLSDRTSYRVAYQYVDTRRGYRDGPLGPGSFEPAARRTSHFDGRTDTLQARLDHQLGARQSLTAGYELMREEYLEDRSTPGDGARASVMALRLRSHALFGQDQIRLLDGRLHVTLAGRMQVFSLLQPDFTGTTGNPYAGAVEAIDTPNGYTGDVSAAYFLDGSQTKLRVHGGNSYRAPSTYERFGGGGGVYYGDPRLGPERSASIDGGVDQWLFDGRLSLGATVFWTGLSERIAFGPVPADDPFQRPFGGYANGGRGSAAGVELGASLAPSGTTRAQVAYTFARATSDVPTFGADYFRILGSVPHTLGATVTRWFMPGLSATFDLYARSGYHLTMFGASGRLFEFDASATANLVVAYDLPALRRGVQLYAKIDNLFDHRPYEDGFVGPGRWAVVGARLRY